MQPAGKPQKYAWVHDSSWEQQQRWEEQWHRGLGPASWLADSNSSHSTGQQHTGTAVPLGLQLCPARAGRHKPRRLGKPVRQCAWHTPHCVSSMCTGCSCLQWPLVSSCRPASSRNEVCGGDSQGRNSMQVLSNSAYPSVAQASTHSGSQASSKITPLAICLPISPKPEARQPDSQPAT